MKNSAGLKRQTGFTGFPWLSVSLCLLFVLSACQGPTEITSQQIEKFLNEVDAASAKKNPEVLLSHLAPNAVITATLKGGPKGPQLTRYSAKDYAETVRQQLPQLTDYKYQRADTKIRIAPDKRTAQVDLRVVESFALGKATLRINTTQTSLYSLEKGKLWIKSVTSDSEVGPGK